MGHAAWQRRRNLDFYDIPWPSFENVLGIVDMIKSLDRVLECDREAVREAARNGMPPPG
jgi:hypothetical protein